MSKSIKYRRKGTLNVIAGLLLASAMIRLSTGTGVALAETLNSDPNPPTEVADNESNAQTSALLEAIRQREDRLAEREFALENRLLALEVAETEIAEQLRALESAEASLRETLALADMAAESDLARLTAVYENMKPKEAAALFEAMSPEFSAGFLGRMRPEAAALIMTQLTPEIAYSISVILAGRNANVPTE